MNELPTPSFIGHVWMNGDPWLVADRADAESWTGFEGDYEKILELTGVETAVAVGTGAGLILFSDYDDSTVEVFRISASELLIVGVRYADPIDYSLFIEDALRVELEPEGSLDVRSGEVVIFGSGLPWSEGSIVDGTPMEPHDRLVEHHGEILRVPLRPGTYDLLSREVDRERYGLAIWRLRIR